jgi:2-keto-4-pentenoate hydratase/2-oxohepta-3-ene-1,7-dioic acid hydratase in catechol pathway
MPLNITRVQHNDQIMWAKPMGSDLELLEIDATTTGDLIRNFDINQLRDMQGKRVSWQDVTLLSPLTQNQQFVCQGANYRQHMIESGVNPDDKTFNMIFTKAASCICAADSPVVKPKGVHLLDYEVELGLVLKCEINEGVSLSEEDLPNVIAGLVIVNDYSARDIQLPQMQFYKGKSFRTFGPVGPWLCLLETEDYRHLTNLDLELRVDDEVRQQDNTRNVVYQAAETLTELSLIQDFAPGDLIATGTPAGCALRAPSPRIQRMMGLIPEKTKWRLFLKAQRKRTQYLRPGQTVTTSIKSPCGQIDLGTQSNLVIAER